MWHVVVAATSNGGGAVYVPGPFLAFFIGRALWRQTKVTLPDGRRVTRGQELAMRRQQAAANRAAWKAYHAEQKRTRQG